MKLEIVEKLRRAVGREALVVDETELLVYECDALAIFKHKPDAVVFAQTTQQVSDVVKIACEYGLPFLPRGSGTGLSGGALAAEVRMIRDTVTTASGARVPRVPVFAHMGLAPLVVKKWSMRNNTLTNGSQIISQVTSGSSLGFSWL